MKPSSVFYVCLCLSLFLSCTTGLEWGLSAQTVTDHIPKGLDVISDYIPSWDDIKSALSSVKWHLIETTDKVIDFLKETGSDVTSHIPSITIPNSSTLDEVKKTFDTLTKDLYPTPSNVTVVKFVFQEYNGALDWSYEELAEKLGVSQDGAKRIIKITAIGVAGGIVMAVIAPELLPVIGFTVDGVSAGSIASVTQAAIYGGETTGLFSLFQSVGVLGVSTSARLLLAMAGESASWIYAGVTARFN